MLKNSKKLIFLVWSFHFIYVDCQAIDNQSKADNLSAAAWVKEYTPTSQQLILAKHIAISSYFLTRYWINPILISRFIDKSKKPYIYSATHISLNVASFMAERRYYQDKRPFNKLLLGATVKAVGQEGHEIIWDKIIQKNPVLQSNPLKLLVTGKLKMLGQVSLFGFLNLCGNEAINYASTRLME